MVKIHSKNKKPKLKQAFTLVELIIVIAVIAVLAIFLIPNFSNVINDTNATQVKNDTTNLKTTIMAYISETGAVPVANGSTANNVLTITNGSDTYKPGVSAAGFAEAAEKTPDTYWLIDMDLLINKQININDATTITSPKLTSLPSTSAIIDVEETSKKVSTSKKIKNTSVCYVIDADYNVYAAHNKSVKGNKQDNNAYLSLPGEFNLLDDANGTEQDKTFKQGIVKGVNVAATITVDDSNYNQ